MSRGILQQARSVIPDTDPGSMNLAAHWIAGLSPQ